LAQERKGEEKKVGLELLLGSSNRVCFEWDTLIFELATVAISFFFAWFRQ